MLQPVRTRTHIFWHSLRAVVWRTPSLSGSHLRMLRMLAKSCCFFFGRKVQEFTTLGAVKHNKFCAFLLFGYQFFSQPSRHVQVQIAKRARPNGTPFSTFHNAEPWFTNTEHFTFQSPLAHLIIKDESVNESGSAGRIMEWRVFGNSYYHSAIPSISPTLYTKQPYRLLPATAASSAAVAASAPEADIDKGVIIKRARAPLIDGIGRREAVGALKGKRAHHRGDIRAHPMHSISRQHWPHATKNAATATERLASTFASVTAPRVRSSIGREPTVGPRVLGPRSDGWIDEMFGDMLCVSLPLYLFLFGSCGSRHISPAGSRYGNYDSVFLSMLPRFQHHLLHY